MHVESSCLDGGFTETRGSRGKSHEVVRERLSEALGGTASKLGVAAQIAAQIDDALHEQLGDKEYFAQVRNTQKRKYSRRRMDEGQWCVMVGDGGRCVVRGGW